MDYTQSIKDYIELEIETLKKLNVEDINKAMNLMDDKSRRNYFCVRKWWKFSYCITLSK